MVDLTLTAATALAVTAALMPLVMKAGRRLSLTSKPRLFGASMHRIPNTGGLAVLIGISLAFSLFWGVPTELGLALGAVLAIILGLADDLWQKLGARPGFRLAVQLGIAFSAWAAGLRSDTPGMLGIALTVLFLVGCMNAFNLLDNMDGVAATTGAGTAGGIAVVALAGGQLLVAALSLAIAGACLGFLPYNINHARAYLGNGGSLLLGFMIGGVALKLRLPVPHPWAIIAVLGLLGVAIADTSMALVSRILHHRPIMQGGTDHISHRLVSIGLKTWQAALMHGLAAVLSAAIIAIGIGEDIYGLILAPPIFLSMSCLTLLTVDVYRDSSIGRRRAVALPLIALLAGVALFVLIDTPLLSALPTN